MSWSMLVDSVEQEEACDDWCELTGTGECVGGFNVAIGGGSVVWLAVDGLEYGLVSVSDLEVHVEVIEGEGIM